MLRQDKIGSLLTVAAFLLIGVSAGMAQQNPAVGGAQGPGQGAARVQQPPAFGVTSTSMADGNFLATKYTCTAGPAAVSPDLRWMNAPRDTAEFVLIAHDMEPRPRKGVDDILHWMVWNIPSTATQIPEGVPSDAQQLPDGSLQTNGNPGQGGNVGYRPPCPPAGPSHHYAFEVFAVDQKLAVAAAATRAEVLKAMDGHIVAHAALVVPYHQ